MAKKIFLVFVTIEDEETLRKVYAENSGEESLSQDDVNLQEAAQ